jgi:hypothetical protein
MSTQQRSKKSYFMTLVTVAAVLLAAAGTWGIISFSDAQLTEEARGYASAVQDARDIAEEATQSHLAHLEDARFAYETMHTPFELIQTRSELFSEETVGTFADALEELAEVIEDPEIAHVTLEVPFNHSGPDGDFVQAYREASTSQREQLAQESEAIVERLQRVATSLEGANGPLFEVVEASQRAALAVAESLPDRAESIVTKYPEADQAVVVALRDTVADDAWDVDSEDIAQRMTALQQRVTVYIEHADRIRDNHEEAERRAAEAAEAERRAAAAAAPSGGGGEGASGDGGGYEIVQMCNRLTVGFDGSSYLSYEPC